MNRYTSQIFAVFFILILAQNTEAITYSFTGSTPADPAFTTNNLVIPLARQDDFDTIISPFGFSYFLSGTTYSKVIVSANGWIALLPASAWNMPGYFGNGLPHNALSTYSGGLPLYAPLWDDHSCSLIQYGMNGNLLTVRWTIKWDKTYTGTSSALIWMTLDCSTGVVTFNYSNTVYVSPPSVSASIGIAGICNGLFYSVTPDNIPSNSTFSSTVEDTLVNFKPVDVKYIFTPNITTLSWQGTVDTLYDNGSNWSSCSGPDCSISAIIDTTPSGNMPVVRSNQSVKDLTIMPGASLTVMTGYSLSICGNFINNGTLIAMPGSSINLTGTGTQSVTGLFTNTNAFAHFYIYKQSGDVIINDDIDVTENFTMHSGSSFNINGRYMTVGGNFTALNFTGIGGSTVEFNGIMAQYFNASNTHLNNVKINKPNGNIYLGGPIGNMIIDSALYLISGNIITSPSLEVSVLNASVSAIQNYSEISYIDGRLRRAVYSGSIDFPVGDSMVVNQGGHHGYELANISFTTSTSIPDLLVWFSIWHGMPPLGPIGPDTCGNFSISYNGYQLYDNGYWYFQKDLAVDGGQYDVTLYNTGGTNFSGGVYHTIATAPRTFNPVTASSWSMIGACNTISTLLACKRDNYSGAAGESFNHIYSTAQGTQGAQVDVNELDNYPDFIISPNPIADISEMKIYSEYDDQVQFELREISGKLIKLQKLHLVHGENTIVSKVFNYLSDGIYLIRIVNGNGIYDMKLVIQ